MHNGTEIQPSHKPLGANKYQNAWLNIDIAVHASLRKRKLGSTHSAYSKRTNIGQQLARHLHVTVSQGFGGPRSSSSLSCTCICITDHFFLLTDTAASASAILLQHWTAEMGGVRAPTPLPRPQLTVSRSVAVCTSVPCTFLIYRVEHVCSLYRYIWLAGESSTYGPHEGGPKPCRNNIRSNLSLIAVFWCCNKAGDVSGLQMHAAVLPPAGACSCHQLMCPWTPSGHYHL
jgi:hypothetical protein